MAAARRRAISWRWSHEDFYVPLAAELSLMRGAGLTPEVTWRRDSFAVIVASA